MDNTAEEIAMAEPTRAERIAALQAEAKVGMELLVDQLVIHLDAAYELAYLITEARDHLASAAVEQEAMALRIHLADAIQRIRRDRARRR